MNFHPVSNYLVCGASSGIGLALLFKLLESNPNSHVYATHRATSNLDGLNQAQQQYPQRVTLVKLEATTENDYIELAKLVESNSSHLDGIINSIGVLHGENFHPERKIEELSVEDHLKVYAINTLPTLLIGKHFKKLIKESDNPFLVSVSAKVGSIGDNRMGGWHSYRVSKAALNMVIKNLSIEFKRANKNSKVLAIHPGTTESKLSEPFMSGARKKYKIHSTNETAANILKVINGLESRDTGRFFSWDGSELPW